MSSVQHLGKSLSALAFAALLLAACSFPDRTFDPDAGGNAGSAASNGGAGAGGAATSAGGSIGMPHAGAGGSLIEDSGGTTNIGGSPQIGDGGSPNANGGSPNTNGGSPDAKGGTPGVGGNSSRGGTPNAGGTPTAGGSPSAGGGTNNTGGGTNNTGGGTNNAGTTGLGGTPANGGSVSTTPPISVGYSQFHDSESGPENASGSLIDATFVKPAGTVEGDFMLVFLGCDHHLNIDKARIEAMDWKLIDALGDKGTDEQGMYLMYHFATATEPSTTVFRDINYTQYTNGVQGLMAVYRGVDPTMPVNAYDSTFDAYTLDTPNAVTTATPAITTTVGNCLAIAGLSPDSQIDAPVITSWPAGFVDNRISVNNPPHPYPYGWANIYSAERSLPTAGLLPASAFEWKQVDKTTYFGGITFVLALAPRR